MRPFTEYEKMQASLRILEQRLLDRTDAQMTAGARDAARIRQLEEENAQLRKALAELKNTPK